MKQTNILCKNRELSDEQYCLYDTRIENKTLLSTYLVGNIQYSDKVIEGGTYHKGEVLLKIELLGVSYDYACYGKVKVIKKYCEDGSIVDYNRPILLMERIKE